MMPLTRPQPADTSPASKAGGRRTRRLRRPCAVGTVVRPTVGADRDVEPAGDDDHGLAHRQHAEDGDAEPDVEEVARGKEDVAAQGAEDQDQHDKGDRQADVVHADAIDDPLTSDRACGRRRLLPICAGR